MVRKLVLPFLLAVLLMVPVWSLAEEQVIDEIGVLEAAEIDQLSRAIQRVENQYVMDVAVLITDKVPADPSDDMHIVMNYADSYYDEHRMGMRANASGILYLLDMNNRVIWLTTCGDMMYYVNDRREECILDAIYECVIHEDYYGSIMQYINLLDEYLWQGIENGTYLYD